jgi:hypothetical protein
LTPSDKPFKAGGCSDNGENTRVFGRPLALPPPVAVPDPALPAGLLAALEPALLPALLAALVAAVLVAALVAAALVLFPPEELEFDEHAISSIGAAARTTTPRKR